MPPRAPGMIAHPEMALAAMPLCRGGGQPITLRGRGEGQTQRRSLRHCRASADRWRPSPTLRPARMKTRMTRFSDQLQRGSSRAAGGRQSLGRGDAAPSLGEEHLAGSGPVVADRPDQPQPDQHRHQQAQDRDLVRAVARASRGAGRGSARTASGRSTWLPLPTSP